MWSVADDRSPVVKEGGQAKFKRSDALLTEEVSVQNISNHHTKRPRIFSFSSDTNFSICTLEASVVIHNNKYMQVFSQCMHAVYALEG